MPLNDNVRTETNDFLARHESMTDYVYIDTGRDRNPTIGFGHNLTDNMDRGTCRLIDPTTQRVATPEQCREHVRQLRAFAATQNNNAVARSFRGRGLGLVTTNRAITEFRDNDVNDAYGAATAEFNNFDTFPEDAQVAILSVVFNVGSGNFRGGYPRLRAAIQRNDWNAASAEINRGANGGQPHADRIAAERALFQRAQAEQTRRNAARNGAAP